jgi:hypothetical protein
MLEGLDGTLCLAQKPGYPGVIQVFHEFEHNDLSLFLGQMFHRCGQPFGRDPAIHMPG